jgi:hypothetical protein
VERKGGRERWIESRKKQIKREKERETTVNKNF